MRFACLAAVILAVSSLAACNGHTSADSSCIEGVGEKCPTGILGADSQAAHNDYLDLSGTGYSKTSKAVHEESLDMRARIIELNDGAPNGYGYDVVKGKYVLLPKPVPAAAPAPTSPSTPAPKK